MVWRLQRPVAVLLLLRQRRSPSQRRQQNLLVPAAVLIIIISIMNLLVPGRRQRPDLNFRRLMLVSVWQFYGGRHKKRDPSITELRGPRRRVKCLPK